MILRERPIALDEDQDWSELQAQRVMDSRQGTKQTLKEAQAAIDEERQQREMATERGPDPKKNKAERRYY